LQGFDSGVVGVGVHEDAVVRGLAGFVFHGHGEAALEVEAVVVVEQAVDVAGAAEVGAADVVQAVLEGVVRGATAFLVAAEGVAHAAGVGVGDLATVVPGAGAVGETVHAGAVGAGGRCRRRAGRRRSRLFGIGAVGQHGLGVSHPACSHIIFREGSLPGSRMSSGSGSTAVSRARSSWGCFCMMVL